MQVVDYSKGNNLLNYPSFVWWFPIYLRKRIRMISKIKSHYWKRTHKYGIRVPKLLEGSVQIDKGNGKTLW